MIMRVELIRDARIRHKAGEIVEVSPEEYVFLTSVGAAKAAEAEKLKKETKKK